MEPQIELVTCFCIALVALAIKFNDRFVGTESRPDIPGPPGLPIVGNLHQIFPKRHKFLKWLVEMSAHYKGAFTFTSPPWGRGIVINQPEWLAHVKQGDIQKYSRGPIAIGLFEEFPGKGIPVSTEGEAWRAARKRIQPIFSIRAFTDHVQGAMFELIPVCKQLLTEMHRKDNSGVVDWNDLAGRLAHAIFCKSVFSASTPVLTTSIDCLQAPDVLRDSLFTLNRISSSRLLNPYWSISEILDGNGAVFREARKRVWNYVEDLIQTRLSIIESGANEEQVPSDFLTLTLTQHEHPNMTLLRDELVTLVFAGRDNTQNVLAWAMYGLLTSDPIWVDKLREESLALSAGQCPDYDSISRYHIHNAVLTETLRLWPGLPKNARLAIAPDELPAIPERGFTSPIKISQGDYVFWSDYVIMRDPQIWGPDANDFKPGRHLDSENKFIKPSSPEFIPFGAGPRLCPASRLTTYEFISCLAGILPYFDFELDPSTVLSKPEIAEAFTIAMDGRLNVRITPRFSE